MPGAEVALNFPLQRLNPWFPGQFGVEGAWTDTGIRQHCTGTVFYVSPNHPGASDSRDGTDPNDPLLTIQTAVARCESFRGDVIAVMPHGVWTYGPGTPYPTGIVETVTLDKHGVRLVGLTAGGAGVGWEPAATTDFCLTVTGLECTVEGFMFWDGGNVAAAHGIYFDWDGTDAWGENGVVRYCSFAEGIGEAIKLNFCYFMHIHHNHFSECEDYGIWSDSGGAQPNEDPPAYGWIHDNVFTDVPSDGSGAAIWIPGADNMSIFRNAVYNSDAQGAAAATDEGIVTNDGTVAGAENLVWQNVFSCQNTAIAAGDYGDLNGGSASDCWTQSYCMNAIAYAVP